jgi:hypothetical protein
MNQMAIDFLGSMIFLPSLPIFKLIFFDIGLIDLHKGGIPLLLINGINDHKYFKAEFIMDSLFLF